MHNYIQFRFILHIGGETLNIMKIINTNLGDVSGVKEGGGIIRENRDLKLLLMVYFLRWLLTIINFLKTLHVLYTFVW